jgi:hypothetical protein
LLVVLLGIAPASQELEPPANPGRFNAEASRDCEWIVAAQVESWLGFLLQRFDAAKWIACRLMGTSSPMLWRHAGRA